MILTQRAMAKEVKKRSLHEVNEYFEPFLTLRAGKNRQ